MTLDALTFLELLEKPLKTLSTIAAVHTVVRLPPFYLVLTPYL